MSLINGINGMGAGLGAFAGDALKDEVSRVRVPLLNGAAARDVAQPAPTKPADTTDHAPATEPAAPQPAPLVVKIGVAGGVPADLLPIYQAAAKRTGIPIDVLVAQGRQESGFDPKIVSDTGGIGLHQIQAATARDPGYGVAPVDPATLKNPVVNINFAADYLKAKAGGNIDFSNPKAVNAALAAYNGGGDPNYVANVRRWMGAS